MNLLQLYTEAENWSSMYLVASTGVYIIFSSHATNVDIVLDI